MFQETNANYENNGESINKKECRNLFYDSFKELDISDLRYVGLPSTYPFLEKRFISNYNDAKLFLVEINPDVFQEQVRLLPTIRTVYQTITHVRDNVFNCFIPFKINAIWLDLCNMIKPLILDNIRCFLEGNQFEEKGVFALTYFATREHPEVVSFYRDLQAEYLPEPFESSSNFKKKKFPIIFGKILETLIGKPVELITSKPYLSENSTNMQYIAYKWGKS